MEDFADTTAGADAACYGGECGDQERAAQHDGEQLAERRNGDGIVVEGLGQCDSSREAEDGAGERGEHLCRGQSCADLIDIEIPSSSDNEPAVA